LFQNTGTYSTLEVSHFMRYERLTNLHTYKSCKSKDEQHNSVIDWLKEIINHIIVMYSRENDDLLIKI